MESKAKNDENKFKEDPSKAADEDIFLNIYWI